MAYPEYPSNVVTSLVAGIPIIMAQTTIYAMPNRAVTILSTNTNTQISPDGVVGFQTIANVTTGAVIVGAGFVRSIGSTATVILQKV